MPNIIFSTKRMKEEKNSVRFAVTFAALQWEFVHFILYFDTFFILNYKYNWQKQTKHAQRQRHHKKMARKAMILQNLMGWFCGLQSLRSNKRTAKRNETNALISSFEILHQFIC